MKVYVAIDSTFTFRIQTYPFLNVKTRVSDKRYRFPFPCVNFPFWMVTCAWPHFNGLYISHLVCIALGPSWS